ncbi:MAG: hypothetical protein IPJ19_15400 [Planctomycetes bacterium]|nr:hypothetical protein [Planctomycetota bacterium]
MNEIKLNPSVQDALVNAAHDPFWQIVAGVTTLVFVLASLRLCSKAGYHALFGLLLLVPVVNVFVFLFLAFSRWPIERELRELRSVQQTARRVDQDRLRRAA